MARPVVLAPDGDGIVIAIDCEVIFRVIVRETVGGQRVRYGYQRAPYAACRSRRVIQVGLERNNAVPHHDRSRIAMLVGGDWRSKAVFPPEIARHAFRSAPADAGREFRGEDRILVLRREEGVLDRPFGPDRPRRAVALHRDPDVLGISARITLQNLWAAPGSAGGLAPTHIDVRDEVAIAETRPVSERPARERIPRVIHAHLRTGINMGSECDWGHERADRLPRRPPGARRLAERLN